MSHNMKAEFLGTSGKMYDIARRNNLLVLSSAGNFQQSNLSAVNDNQRFFRFTIQPTNTICLPTSSSQSPRRIDHQGIEHAASTSSSSERTHSTQSRMGKCISDQYLKQPQSHLLQKW